MATTLLGDPEVDLYTNAVIPMQVAHPGSAALGSAPITFTVTAQGSPVPGATVTLWKADEVYVRGRRTAPASCSSRTPPPAPGRSSSPPTRATIDRT